MYEKNGIYNLLESKEFEKFRCFLFLFRLFIDTDRGSGTEKKRK